MTVSDPFIMDEAHFNNINIHEVVNSLKGTEIQKFYRDANIFITGSTGFLGKVLVEKLLRSCTNISTLYLLIRNKKGKNMNMRVEEIFDDVIFDRLKKECPKFRHKVVGIAGDCLLADLGLSIQDKKVLVNEVNIIFHVAATVRFDEKLRTAIAINIRAPQDILLLAHEMAQLKSFIHVSTAFANCTGSIIDEKFYPTTIDYKKLIVMSETLNDKMMDHLTPMLLGEYPNTYAFTKQVAEDAVRQCGDGLPVGITRPSIVVATYREPVRAWINNVYGATGVATGVGLGLLRTLHCDPDCQANIIPVDLCVNSIIASAWDVSNQFIEAKNNEAEFEIPIYNCESSCNSITWKEFMDRSVHYGSMTPTAKAIWYLSLTIQKSYIWYVTTAFFLHTIPALIVDGALLCLGRSPRMSKVYTKVHKFISVLSYFSTKSWIFRSENIRKLCIKMSDEDNELFFSDMEKLDWDEFFQHYLRGVRVYLLNDPMDTLDEALIRWRRLYWAHQITKAVVGFLLLRLLWFILSFFFAI